MLFIEGAKRKDKKRKSKSKSKSKEETETETEKTTNQNPICPAVKQTQHFGLSKNLRHLFNRFVKISN